MDKSKAIAGLLVIIFLFGCAQVTITGSGNVISQEEILAGFDQVDVSSSFIVDITQGEDFSVVIRSDDNLVEHLQVVKSGSTLKIGLDPGKWYIINDATMEAEVTMPDLVGIDLSGSSIARVSGFESQKSLSVDVSGGSIFQGDMHAGDVSIDSSGSSSVILSGSAGDIFVDASGSSEVDLADFPAANGTVNTSGGSTATVNLGGRLDADASGSSDIYYLGELEFGKMETSGSSSIQPR